MDNELQFAGQLPEVRQKIENAGPRIAGVLSGLDLIATVEYARQRENQDGSTFIEVYPNHEYHDEKPPLTEMEIRQSRVLSDYVTQAVTELPEGSSEETIWDRVFEIQLKAFEKLCVEPADDPRLDEAVLNILVANLLAARRYKSPEEKQQF